MPVAPRVGARARGNLGFPSIPQASLGRLAQHARAYQNRGMLGWDLRRLCAALAACQLACGDPGSIEVPLPLGRVMPKPGSSTGSVLVVEGSGSDARCAFEVSLPDADASRTLLTGAGERFISRAETQVECRIRQSGPPEAMDNVFDVALRISERSFSFELGGTVSLGQTTMLELAMSLSRNAELVEAVCSVEPKTLLPGAAWLPSFTCDSVRYNAMPAACRIEGGAIFENCDP